MTQLMRSFNQRVGNPEQEQVGGIQKTCPGMRGQSLRMLQAEHRCQAHQHRPQQQCAPMEQGPGQRQHSIQQRGWIEQRQAYRKRPHDRGKA